MTSAPHASIIERRKGFCSIAHAYHIDAHLDAEHATRHRERRTPLAGAGFGRDAPHARDAIVVGLRTEVFGLCEPGGADTFVLVVNLRGRPERVLPGDARGTSE